MTATPIAQRTTSSLEAELKKLRRRAPYTSEHMPRCRAIAAELAYRNHFNRKGI